MQLFDQVSRYILNELGQTGKQQTERVKKSEPVGFEPARTHLYQGLTSTAMKI